MSQVITARELGVVGCHACALVCRAPPAHSDAACPRCGARLHARKPDSLTRSWAMLITAAILYIPANLLPMMDTTNILEQRSDTIVSGVIQLWDIGSWDLAIIVFTASVLVPLMKILVLGLLLYSVQRRSHWDPLERARLYRFIEFIGRWSMLDIFVVALLISLVNFDRFGEVRAGPGSIAFGAVVVLTMLSSLSFDPRLIWDEHT
ncbi:MAG TPA: paraquat-inducible protein A [Nevskiaceae bacterium]|nr:paraquat-inducible protein A [Nevskiaceae bacterium]